MEIILTTFVLANLALGLLIWFKFRKLYGYPGLLGFPVIGNLYYFYKVHSILSFERIRTYLADLATKHGKNGLCFHYAFGFRKMVVVSSPEVVKQIGSNPNLKDKPNYFVQSFKDYFNGPFCRPEADDLWKTRRKEYVCLLRKARVENNFYKFYLRAANKLVEEMLSSPSSVDILEKSLGVTQSVTMATLFGFQTSLASHPQIIHYLHTITNIASLVLGNPVIAKLIISIIIPFDEYVLGTVGDLRKIVLKELYKEMNSKKSSSEDNGLYNFLPKTISSRIERNKKFEWTIVTELQEAMLSSSLTVAPTLASLMTCLAVLPEIQEKAWNEQYEIFGTNDREPTIEDLERMTYLDRYIKETFRFCGPPLLAKQASDDIEVNGIIIPKDTIVVYLTDFMSRDPTIWKDPDIFNPDRFLEECEDGSEHFSVSFGIGVRNCPGRNSAMLQLKTVLSKVLRRTKLSLVNKNIKFKDLKFQAKLLMELGNPQLLQVEERTY